MKQRHVILVGLPGAGKTTVGRLAALRLGAPFTDLDDVIAAREGLSVARIFAERGEGAFRALETAAGEVAFGGRPGVIAVGGGFVGDPARRRAALAAGVVIYLETTPDVAASRLEGMTGRPLLDGQNLPARLRDLLAQREGAYLESQQAVTTDGASPEQVADEVVKLARERGGW